MDTRRTLDDYPTLSEIGDEDQYSTKMGSKIQKPRCHAGVRKSSKGCVMLNTIWCFHTFHKDVFSKTNGSLKKKVATLQTSHILLLP